ncbi:MAG: sugar phosphate nucleotidyltransferase [Candidatus Beckwithbacteria bacterium]
MQALILAAGFGVRLREIIHGRPKHLAPINGKPFLRHLLQLLKRHGFKRIILSIGYLSQYILDEFNEDQKEFGLIFSDTKRPLGTAGSLKKAQNYLKDDFFVINGDTYLDVDYQQILKFHTQHSNLLTLVGTNKNQHGSIIRADHGQVVKFIYHPDKAIPASFRHAGIAVVSPQLFSLIPSATKYSLEKDIIPQLIKKNQLGFFPVNQAFIDIGTPLEYQKAILKLK